MRREYVSRLAKGFTHFNFLVVSRGPVREWLDHVKCVLETNVSATIVVKQVNGELPSPDRLGAEVVVIGEK